MRGVLIAGLLCAPGILAQTLIDPARVPKSLYDFSPQPEDQRLRCEVTPIRPSLDFSFRFQTGYSVAVPMMQYLGPGHVWAIITRVTPENGAAAWLLSRVRLPDVPLTTVVTNTFGGFMVGAGKYRVDWALYDDQGRVCRQQWKIDAKLSFGERHIQTSVPPHTVADFSGAGLPPKPPPAADTAPFRLTVLLHAAPASPRRLHLRINDRILLISTLSALLERAKPTSVRLAVFNLDKQRVLYSSENFKLRSMGEVNQAINRLELETVDVQTLQNPHGHIDLLKSLIDAEDSSPKPSDAVVFLGPAARYIDKLPASALDAPPEGTRFYYFQYRPFPAARQAMLPDSISNALSSLKGRIFHIAAPAQFDDAIREMERMSRH